MRTVGFVRALARHADVKLACFGTGPPLPLERVPVESVGAKPGSRRVLGPDLPHVAAANLFAPNLRLPLQVRASLDRRMTRLVERELRDFRPHVVHAMPSTMAPHLPPPGSCHRHLDLNDALSLSISTQASEMPAPVRPAMQLEACLLRRYEAAAARSADSCSLAAAPDRRASGLSGVDLLAPGVDTVAFRYKAPTARPPLLLFFGNLAYNPNVHAARFVVREVLPHARAGFPGVQLRLVGADPPRAVRALGELEGVELVGRVDDIAAELHACSVAVLPSVTGAGLKTKVQEAFSAGTPVVANRAGIEGIEGAEAGTHYLAGETPEALAQAAVSLLRDEGARVRLAEQARCLIEAFSWESQAERLLRLYGDAATRFQVG